MSARNVELKVVYGGAWFLVKAQPKKGGGFIHNVADRPDSAQLMPLILDQIERSGIPTFPDMSASVLIRHPIAVGESRGYICHQISITVAIAYSNFQTGMTVIIVHDDDIRKLDFDIWGDKFEKQQSSKDGIQYYGGHRNHYHQKVGNASLWNVATVS